MSFTVTSAVVKKVAKALDASNFDLAAGLREDEFNNFFTAHYNNQSPGGVPGGVYSGNGTLDDLGLAYTYTVNVPIMVTISPLTTAQFKPLVDGWLKTVPEISRLGPPPKNSSGSFSDPPPPNIQLKAPQMTLTVTATDGSINPPAVLNFSMTATGFVAASTAADDVTVTVVPVAVRLDNPGKVGKNLAAILKEAGFREKAAPNPDCIPLQQLILHIVNAVVAPRLSSFVKEFTFPVPIKLFNNAAVTGVTLVVEEKLVIVLASIGAATASSSLLSLNNSILPAEIKSEKDRLVSAAQADHKANAGESKKRAIMKKFESGTDYPNRGLFLLMHQRFFQILADAFLNTSAGQQGGGSFGPIFYNYSWSMKTWNPLAAISGSSLVLSVNCEGSAGASAGVHTHCGDISASLSATADALPANFGANFYFENNNRELWTSLAPQPFSLQWSIGGLPWPLGDAVSGLLDIFTNLGIAFIVALGLRWKQKLTTVPDYFPGTALKYELALDQQVQADASTGALMVAGTINFDA